MLKLSETHVRAAVMRWLQRRGYGFAEPKEKYEHGPDINVKHVRYGRRFVVEVKGDPKKAIKPDGVRSANIRMILGQITTRMRYFETRYHYYGLALPLSYFEMIKRLPWQFFKRTNLSVFLVDKNRKVRWLNWRELQKLNPTNGNQ